MTMTQSKLPYAVLSHLHESQIQGSERVFDIQKRVVYKFLTIQVES